MNRPSDPQGKVIVIGASGIDLVGRLSQPLAIGTSNPGALRMSHGGVARNVAENLARLGVETVLVTAVGEDENGERILSQAEQAGVDVRHCVRVPGARTGAYLALLDDHGVLHAGVDDMRVIQSLEPSHLERASSIFSTAEAVFLDANLEEATLASAFELANVYGLRVAADPTSRVLAPRLLPHLSQLWLVTPNQAEALVLSPAQAGSQLADAPGSDDQEGLGAARRLVAAGAQIAVVALAEFGVAYASAELSGHVPALRTEVADPTGAGDAMTAALLFALLQEIPLDEAVRLGAAAAALTLRTRGTVVPNLSLELLYDELR